MPFSARDRKLGLAMMPLMRLTPIVLAAFLGHLLPALCGASTILEAGPATTWKFLDAGAGPPSGWRDIGFDDSSWRSGSAPLGYGEKRARTEVNAGTNALERPVTTWFRHQFVAPALGAEAGTVLLLCVDDGAVVYLNGNEIGRLNLPKGKVTAGTLAAREVADKSEGMYLRLPLPKKALRASTTNVLAVEVHQASTNDADLFFDLALKTLPADTGAPQVTDAARPVLDSYHQRHYVGPESKVPDGYFDGGRHMRLDARGRATSGREILLVDRGNDPELRREIAFARSEELRRLPELERVQRLAAYIDDRTTPPGGDRWVGPTIEVITREFANKPLRIGDVIEQSQAGVCRHRSLLFKILADEAGLKAALVRGNYAIRGRKPGFAHAWNEVELANGRRVLVDVMHHGGKAHFPEVSSPEVVQNYLRENDTPWYKLAEKE